MKNIKNSLLGISRNIVLAIIGVLILSGAMMYQLNSLTPGFSTREVEVYKSARSVSAITGDLVNAPYKSAILISTKIFSPDKGLRLVGALIGIATVIIFYLMIRPLYGDPIAIATSAMLATSSLFLGITRTATPNVMLLSLLLIISTASYIRFSKRKDISWLIATFVLGFSLYVPGMILFVVPLVIWQFRFIKENLSKLETKLLIVMALILGLLITPILLSIAQQPSIIKEYIGFGEVIEPINIMAKYAFVAIGSIFIMSPIDSSYWLGRQPILDVFATAMFICGVYSFIKTYKLPRFWLILGIALLSIAWIGVTTNRYAIIVLLPFIYLVIGGGIRMLTDRWFEVFPKNPIAKYIGVAILFIAIISSINFQANRFFIAWSNHQPTKEAFSEQLPRSN